MIGGRRLDGAPPAILATAAHAGEPNKQGLAFRIGAAGPRASNVRSIRAKAAPILTSRIADHSKPSRLDEIDHEKAGETADRLWKDRKTSCRARKPPLRIRAVVYGRWGVVLVSD